MELSSRSYRGFIQALVFGTLLGTTACQTAATHSDAAAKSSKTITFAHINDVYEIAPVDEGKRGGLARVSYLVQEIRKQSPHSIFVLSGDFLYPSLLSEIFEGKHMIETLNSTGLDISTLGNHEFDLGVKPLLKRIQESKFTYTAANVVDKPSGKPFGNLPRFVMREFDGVKIAVFGLLTRETFQISKPGPGPTVDILEPISVARSVVQDARAQGADLIVAVTHLAMEEDRRLAAEVGDIDVILGGHDHALMETLVGHTLILKMGSDARYLGKVDLKVTECARSVGHRFCLDSIDWVPIHVDQQILEDPKTAAIVARYQSELKTWSNPIGRTLVALNAIASDNRSRETNLGNFIADAYRETLHSDLALLNGGSVRSDSLYPKGTLSKLDAHKILAFRNPIVMVKVTGAKLKEVLEFAVAKLPEINGRYAHVSGMKVTFRSDRPVGTRIEKVLIHGEPLVEDRHYTLATSSFLADGGDGCPLKGSEVVSPREKSPIDQDVFDAAIQKKKVISPKVEKRMVDLSASADVH